MGMLRARTIFLPVFLLLTAACTPAPASPPVSLEPSVPPAATVLPSAAEPVDLARGRTATASNSTPGDPPALAIDGDLDTAWRSGAAAEQWLQIDLGTTARITEIRLVLYQVEAGISRHRILAGASPDALQSVQELSGSTGDRQELVFTAVIPLQGIRYIRIQTLESPGWVAWREVSVFGEFQGTTAGQSQPAADIIYTNAVILTMDDSLAQAEAIAIQGDRILAVGSRAEVIRFQGSDTQVIDLGGLTVTPGFIDSHQHRIGDKWQNGDLPIEQVFYNINEQGWTGIHELWVDGSTIDMYRSLGTEAWLPVRISLYLVTNFDYSIDTWWKAYRPLTQYSPYLQIAGLKITLDREWGQQVFISDQQSLNDLVEDATGRGWQIATHSFSPEANQLILNAYQNALQGGSNASLRLRIEHIGVMTDAELQQMADLGILGSVQLINSGSFPDDDSFKTEIPAELVPLTARWRDLLDAGVFLIGNTDAPWCCTDWRHNFAGPSYTPTVVQALYQGVTRTTFNHRPPEAWQQAQVVTVEEALRMMTIHSAYAGHQEDVLGSLTPGKYADLVVFSGNPLLTPVEEIPTLRVLMTMVGGRVAYCASGHAALCTATASP